MTKKEIIKFLEKYNDDDELCIVLDEDKENNFVYTSKEKDMLGVYKEVIRFLSEQNITFDIMALCEMICSDNIDTLYSLGYVNVNHVVKDNKLHFRISKKTWKKMINLKMYFSNTKMVWGYIREVNGKTAIMVIYFFH